MPVRFDSMDDFVQELERDANEGAIEHKIVRMASPAIIRTNGAGVPFTGTLVGYRARGEIIELTAGGGWLWSMTMEPREDEDAPKRELIKTTAQAIRDLCKQHGLDLRGGRFV